MKIQSPWMGRVKGSAGNMTGCKNYDKNVLKAKAFEVSNPRTSAQVMQRNFMKDVVAISNTVSEEQLRSLFGIKPKTMSRRNALAQQIAAAFTVEDGVKSVDFSKLGAIGNGKKVSTPLVSFVNGVTEDSTVISAENLNVPETVDPNLILVAFDSVDNKIFILNTTYVLSDEPTTLALINESMSTFTGIAYATCEDNGKNVSELDFGSFIIKTRSEKIGR